MEERLQKILAKAGISSRRTAEHLITKGHISINGKIIRTLGIKADIERDEIVVDGQPIKRYQPKIYLMLNKPQGFVTTLKDPKGRPTISHLIKDIGVRVFPVGRLDYDAEGLLVLTNDGALCYVLQHPKYKVLKTYHVKVKGIPSSFAITKLKKGIPLDGRMTLPAKIKKISETKRNAWLEIAITEGRRRQIKRMCQLVGYPVLRLKRVRFGSLRLGSLPPGAHRYLNSQEIQRLRAVEGHKHLLGMEIKSS